MKKYIKKLFIIIILVIISLTTIFYVKADSGWDSDYGGGSDWGGSDWSGSDFGGSSWDSDYGSSGFSGGAVIFVLCIIGLVVYFIITFTRNSNKKIEAHNSFIDSYHDLSLEEYNRYFGMNKDVFKNKIVKQFIDIQESWMNFDYDILRKLCTDELYNQYKTLLETLKLKNEKNIMSDFTINSVSVYKVEEVNGLMEVSVMLDITFRDYVINTTNNSVVRGSKNIIFNNTYELTFVASKNDKIKNCPSCGASVDVKSSEVCEYCRNTIVQISNELVLSKKKIVASYKSKG